MSTNANALIRAGVDAYKAGNRDEARTQLQKATELDPNSEMAWLWLSAVVTTQEEQQICLENVLIINPENERARQGLQSLGIDPDQVTDTGTTQEDYQVPSSSVSVSNEADGPSNEDYDDWVDGLGISANTQEEDLFAEDTTGSDDFFGDDDFSADSEFDFSDDDLFAEETFDDDLSFGDDYGGDYATDDYGGDYVAEDYSGDYATDDYGGDYVAEDYSGDYAVDDYGGDFAGDDLFADTGVASDLPYGNTFDDLYADISTYEAFLQDVDLDLDDYDESEFARDPYAPEPEPPSEPTTTELFAQIPPEIVPTRLVGTIEESSVGAGAIITGVLGVLNVLALVFIIVMAVTP